MSFRFIGLGEVLWDMLPGGRQLGGAPANFAYHACALGAEGRIISRVGRDAEGRDILARLTELGVPVDCIEIDPVAPTGTVSVEVSADGQPRFTIHQDVAWDCIEGEENAREAVERADAVCFGTLAQRHEVSRAAICRLLKHAPPDALRVLDVNLRQQFYSRELIEQSLSLANVLKVNDHELPIISGMFRLGGDSQDQMTQLAENYDLRAVACTRGEDGSLLLVDGRWSDHPGAPTQVVDTVGAGDSFTAAMVLGLLAGWELDCVNARANRLAAFVASSAGATPVLPSEISAPFRLATLAK
ncbi:MAG: carbohydrate kinase family protein [Limisphaerales bacterium]